MWHLAAIISAVWEIPLPRDIAVTGELSIRRQSQALSVDCILRSDGARQAGVKKGSSPGKLR